MLSTCFVTASEVLGVDLWRVHGPAQAMQRHGLPVAVAPLGKDIPTIEGRAPDVLVFSQRASAETGSYATLRDRLCRTYRMLMVVDCCDDPVDVDGWVGQKRATVKNERGQSALELAQDAIRAADLVTVNSKPMAAVVRQLNPNVAVVPDLIDGTRWVPPFYQRAEDSPLARKTYIGVAGGQSHDDDWRILERVWTRVAARYPGVGFVCIGHCPTYLRQNSVLADRIVTIPWLPVDRYQMAYSGLDIGCAPLADSRFNISKSPIKHFEYALAGAATVASPTVYGTVIQDGVTGYLASTVDQWVQAIGKLLDRSHRLRVIDAARRDVAELHTLTKAACERRIALYQEHHERVYGGVKA